MNTDIETRRIALDYAMNYGRGYNLDDVIKIASAFELFLKEGSKNNFIDKLIKGELK